MEPEAARKPSNPVLDLTPAWVRKSPPWILSGIFHLILVLIATTVVFRDAPVRALETRIRPAPRTETEWTDPALPPALEKRPELKIEFVRSNPTLDIEELEIVETPKGEPDVFTDKNLEETGLNDTFGVGSTPRTGKLGRPDGRDGDPPPGWGPPGVVPVFKPAFQWLVDHQSPDGSWDCDGFQEQCKKGKCSGPGFEGYDVGVTALAVLAFAGVGTTPWHGKYRKTVRKGVEWLISQQGPDGAIGHTEVEGWMYNHAIATMALCEIRAMVGGHAHSLRRPTDKAVAFCLGAQNPGMGWRYEPLSGDNDASVTGWFVLALKAARMADMRVPKEHFLWARAFIDRVTDKGYGAGYRSSDRASSYLKAQDGKYDSLPTMTAVAVLCRRLTGQSAKSPEIREGTEILLESLPDPAERSVNHYYWYYGTYALFQATRGPRDVRWKRWRKALMKALIPTQRAEAGKDDFGSWDPVGEWGIAGGRVYSTAINLLTLEANFRYERMN